MQSFTIGGIDGNHVTTSLSSPRFSSDERQGIEGIAYGFAALSLVELIQLLIGLTSWTEISKNSVKGNFSGKSISCPVNSITSISTFGEYVIVSGTSGRVFLVVDNPKKAVKVLNGLLLSR